MPLKVVRHRGRLAHAHDGGAVDGRDHGAGDDTDTHVQAAAGAGVESDSTGSAGPSFTVSPMYTIAPSSSVKDGPALLYTSATRSV